VKWVRRNNPEVKSVVIIPAAIAPKIHSDRGKAGDRIPRKTSCIEGVQLGKINSSKVPAMPSSKIKRRMGIVPKRF
jgi:hypothetical protein